mmetsp:Transcript_25434/g.84124  ORF Transcript_25434/g.84124 Transcript_25434/m.84124 type:complete len:233 (-) Transcript_25434:160-858(-)
MLAQCPSILNPDAKTCEKTFSPFGRSCIVVSFGSGKSNDETKVVRVRVTASCTKSQVTMFAAGMLLLALSRPLAKSKVFQYSSGMLISITIGMMLLFIFLLNKMKVPGSKTMSFHLAVYAGYGFLVVKFAANMFKQILIEYWELVLGYCALFALLGMIVVSRFRRHESSKHDFRVWVLWVIRLVGILCICGFGTKSGLFSSAMLIIIISMYILGRIGKFFKPKDKSKTSKRD